ncbi:hypothetical protein [Dipodfec virus UOA04_Rod_708]|nr:hypothetical protein [Dipodfec virus UOA04_Rod_708]
MRLSELIKYILIETPVTITVYNFPSLIQCDSSEFIHLDNLASVEDSLQYPLCEYKVLYFTLSDSCESVQICVSHSS